MKQTLLLVTLFICFLSNSFAQDSSSPKLSAGISQGVTIGPASAAYPTAGGIIVGFEFPFKDNPVSLTLTSGYTFYVSRGGFSTGFYAGDYGSGSYTYGSLASFVPVMAGLKVYVYKKFFIEGAVGASFNINSYSPDYTGKQVALIYAPGAGYSIPVGASGANSVNVGLGYENRIEPGGGYSQIYIKGVFNFSL